MAETLIVKPLGLVLQKAGLISLEQVKIALQAKKSLPNCKIGEIIAIRGWIKPETANFFAEQWPNLALNQQLQPLGQYLKAAGFISERQIEKILQEQSKSHIKFGDYAVLQGLISQTTLNFFLQQLNIIRENKITEPILENYKVFNRIESYILHNQKCDPSDLLKLYREVRQQGEVLSSGDTREVELIKCGLLVCQENKLKVANSKYMSVFNQDWIEEELVSLQPYTNIRLKMFGLEKLTSLPHKVLTAVNYWTGNQPFLTQKVYQTIQEQKIVIAPGQEIVTINELVQKNLIKNWDTGVAATHFKNIQKKFLDNDNFSTESLLEAYKHLWQQRTIKYNDTPQQKKLIKLGLAKLKNQQISLSNPIYSAVFELDWIEKQLKLFAVTDSPISNLKQNLSPIMSSNPFPALTRRTTGLMQSGGNPSHQDKRTTAQNSNSNSGGSSDKVVPVVLSLLAVLLSGTALYWFGNQLLRTINQKQLITKGNLHLEKRNYSEALGIYNRALRVDEDIATVWINRGYALKGLKKYELMLQSCTSATVIKPESELAWNCRGEASYYLEKYQETVAALDRAIALNPKNPVVWINYAQALHKLEQYPASEIAIERGINLLQQNSQGNSVSLPVAYNEQGKSLLKQHKYSQALQAFARSLAYAPNYLSAQQGKALALAKLGQTHEATRIFARVLVRDDLSPEQQAITWLYKGINFCSMKQPTRANGAFEKALQLATDYNQAVKTAQEDCQ